MLIFIMKISKIMSSLPSLLTFSFALIWFLFRFFLSSNEEYVVWFIKTFTHVFELNLVSYI